ncbi:hypothetical protein CY34DRAFT_811214 [Suillus luteus UH-Slu-Lm8-n1]|uniref:Uncharacterized protein n=1 Tax=Suillus luteus UH-Slu-Lm8-n1 TaxID=930992 RepID=A0A0D0AEM1_9AGAM|nr:hypothetical protein CY34DRAFT_811214 [Suillus luteus UH-Slu-Lm8-n1]
MYPGITWSNVRLAHLWSIVHLSAIRTATSVKERNKTGSSECGSRSLSHDELQK